MAATYEKKKNVDIFIRVLTVEATIDLLILGKIKPNCTLR